MRSGWSKAIVIGLALAAGSGCYTDREGWGGEGTSVSFDVFYDTLSPYGVWLDSPRFGRVWRPYAAVVGSNFIPYGSAGQWVDTDYGWAWDSDYAWGWAPFHYGRWYLDPSEGWVWIPDDIWGPAWVDWRYGGGFVGWAPLPPPGFGLGFGPFWAFVPVNQFGYRNPIHYAVPVSGMRWPWGLTQPVRRGLNHDGTRIPLGPPPERIARAGGPFRTGRVSPPPRGVIAQVRPQPLGPATSGTPPGATRQPPLGRQPPPRAAPSSPRFTPPPATELPPSQQPSPRAPPRFTPPSGAEPPPTQQPSPRAQPRFTSPPSAAPALPRTPQPLPPPRASSVPTTESPPSTQLRPQRPPSPPPPRLAQPSMEPPPPVSAPPVPRLSGPPAGSASSPRSTPEHGASSSGPQPTAPRPPPHR